jgi:DNA-binding Lrp family transcriptional regulator
MPAAFILINVELGAEETVLGELRKIAEVKEAYRVYGVYDTVARVEAETKEKLKEAITYRIRRLPGIRATLSMVVVE